MELETKALVDGYNFVSSMFNGETAFLNIRDPTIEHLSKLF